MAGLRIMTEKICFNFGFHPPFFTLGIVSELPLLSLNQKFLQVATGNRKSLSTGGISDADWHRLFGFCKRQALNCILSMTDKRK